jgi:NADPH:quinone reductase
VAGYVWGGIEIRGAERSASCAASQSSQLRRWVAVMFGGESLKRNGRSKLSGEQYMKIYVVETANGPFRAVEVARPRAGSGQILVNICASGVNPLDLKIRAGQAEHAQQPLPAVLGLDMAGVVAEVGADVTGFRTNDEVYGMVGGVGGLQGTLAEYVLADAALLAHKPKTLTMRQAAVLPLATITAWKGLVDRANVSSGQTVLVHAGAGGVG